MTTDRDVSRALDLWMEEGPAEVNDLVLDRVERRIAGKVQRPGWLLVRRFPQMPTSYRLAAALVAILAVGVVGWQLVPGGGISGRPTPSPIATTTPTPSPGPVVDIPDGPLAAGRYRIRPLPDDPDLGSLALVADVPADWQGHRDVPALTSPRADNDNGVLIGFMKAVTLFSDPCHWDLDGTGNRSQPGDVALQPDRFKLIGALGSNPAYTVIRSEPFDIDGFPAFDLELQLPASDVLASCDTSPDSGGSGGDFLVFGGGFWAQGPDNRWRLAIIEVDGSLLVAMVSSFPETSAIQVAAGQAIVESFQITP